MVRRTSRYGGVVADAGLVVVAISHPGDNAFDVSRVDELSVALTRPADVKRLIDFMLGAWPHASKIDGDRIGFFGMSRGGYTGLALIGGNANFAKGTARCAELTSVRACEMFQDNEIPASAITHDKRIKAAVIADPGFTFLFGPADLKAVRVPVQLWSSEHGGAGVTPQSVAAVGKMLPSSPEYRHAANAGHVAFLAPCSPAQASTIPRICVDAPGFDRVAFHKAFNAEVLAFFRKHLLGTENP
jgi:predicted dienelactone hydrolase